MSSTMLKVKIDRQEPTELFEQVAAEIRRAIADGEAKPGAAAASRSRARRKRAP
jgi:DNA-binding GntR family transcriptional regulator